MDYCLNNVIREDKKMRDRIQILRGIAIIQVVLIHCLGAGVEQVFIRPFINYGVGILVS